jgi:alkylhydroperoxidase family enzyme
MEKEKEEKANEQSDYDTETEDPLYDDEEPWRAPASAASSSSSSSSSYSPHNYNRASSSGYVDPPQSGRNTPQPRLYRTFSQSHGPNSTSSSSSSYLGFFPPLPPLPPTLRQEDEDDDEEEDEEEDEENVEKDPKRNRIKGKARMYHLHFIKPSAAKVSGKISCSTCKKKNEDQRRLQELPHLNIYKRLSQIPGALVPWSDLVKAIYAFDLPPRWREIAICRQATDSRARYEWTQHVALALNQGLTESELMDIEDLPRVTTLSQEENLICDIVDDLIERNLVQSALKRKALRLLGQKYLDQLVVMVSFYCAVAMFTTALEVPLERRAVLKGTTPL